MDILTIKKIIANIPDDYTIEYDKKETIVPINDWFEIVIGSKKLILKWWSDLMPQVISQLCRGQIKRKLTGQLKLRIMCVFDCSSIYWVTWIVCFYGGCGVILDVGLIKNIVIYLKLIWFMIGDGLMESIQNWL